MSKNEKLFQNIPSSYHAVFKKAYAGKSKAAGIKAKCLECCGMQRIEVQECQIETCPLNKFRPYQQSVKPQKTDDVGMDQDEVEGTDD